MDGRVIKELRRQRLSIGAISLFVFNRGNASLTLKNTFSTSMFQPQRTGSYSHQGRGAMAPGSRGYSLKEFEGWVVKRSMWPRSKLEFFLRARAGMLSGHHNPHEDALFSAPLYGVSSETDGKAKRIKVLFKEREFSFQVKTVCELQGWAEVLDANRKWKLKEFYCVDPRGCMGGGGVYEEYDGVRKCDQEMVTIRVTRFDGMSQVEIDRVNRDLYMLEHQRHRGMILVLDVLELEYTLYVVYPRVRSTGEALVQSGVDERGARRVAHQLLEALAQLHDMGYAHTAVNAENVVFLTEDSLRLTNYFGAAKVDACGYLPLNHRYGRGKYLAPECIVGVPCTRKVDVWAVGVLLYAILAKQTPWSAGDVSEIYLNADMSDEYFEGIRVGERCKDLIRKMLALDEEERVSAREALKHDWFDIYNSGTGNQSPV